METKTENRKLIIGIVLMIAGALLLLDTFNITHLPIKHYIFSWKTLLIGIGFILATTKEKATTGYILIGLGVIFWLPSLLDYSITLSQIALPSILIGVGILVITRKGVRRHGVRSKRNLNETTSDFLSDASIFGGGTKIIQSKNFKGGDITAIFGGSEYVFKDSEIIDDNCTVDVFTVFGGSKLIIPDNWVVKSDVISIFGGLNDKRNIRPDDTGKMNVLYLNGVVIFGGIEIKNF